MIGLLEAFGFGVARPRLGDGRKLGRREIAGHVGGAVAAKAHGRHHQPEVGAVAARHRDVRLARQHLRDLADACSQLFMNDVVRVLEDAQQVVPVQVALHPRRVVVDAERQIGGVGDVEEEALDVGLRRADVGRRSQDGAVSSVILGEPDVGNGGFGVVAGAAEDKGVAAVFILAVSTMIFFFSSRGEHGGLAGRAHDKGRRGAVVSLELEQRAERLEVDRAVLVERRDQGDRRAG